MSLRYKRYFIRSSTAFLTLVTSKRQPIFNNKDIIELSVGVLRAVKHIHPFKTKAYVILPDHRHLLLWTEDGHFDRVVQSFKRNVSREIHKRSNRRDRIWQDRFYDHVIRDQAHFLRHLDYIHYNPVHHDQADLPMSYPYSSFPHYVGIGWYSPEWGRASIESIKGMNLE